MSMHADEKSDEGIIPMKQPNKEGSPSAEAVEGRTSPEGNGGETAAARTLRRDTASNGLVAVRRAARQSKSVRFTALLHHITVDLLKQSYLALERNSAPGIDGVTWQAYGENLEEKLTDLHDRDTQGQLPRPSRPTDLHPEGRWIPAAAGHFVSGGQDRPAGGCDSSGGDLRGGLRRVFLWVPAGARPA